MISVLIINDSELLRQGLRATIEAGEDIDVIGDFVPDSNIIKKVKELEPDLTLMSIAHRHSRVMQPYPSGTAPHQGLGALIRTPRRRRSPS